MLLLLQYQTKCTLQQRSHKQYGFAQTIFLGKLTRLESSHMRERLLKFLAFKVVMVAAVWSAALEDSPFWLPM